MFKNEQMVSDRTSQSYCFESKYFWGFVTSVKSLKISILKNKLPYSSCMSKGWLSKLILTHTHSHMDAHMHAHTYTHSHAHTHTHTHIHTHTCMCARNTSTHTYTELMRTKHTYTHLHALSLTHIRMHVCMHTHYTHIATYTRLFCHFNSSLFDRGHTNILCNYPNDKATKQLPCSLLYHLCRHCLLAIVLGQPHSWKPEDPLQPNLQ